MQNDGVWANRPKFNKDRLPKFKSEEKSWVSGPAIKKFREEAFYRQENILVVHKVDKDQKIENYEKPRKYQIVRGRKKGSRNVVNHFHLVKKKRHRVFKKLSTPKPMPVKSSAVAAAALLFSKQSESRKPIPPPSKDRKHVPPAFRVAMKLQEYREDQQKAQELRDSLGAIIKQRAAEMLRFSKGKDSIKHNKTQAQSGAHSPAMRQRKLRQNARNQSSKLERANTRRFVIERQTTERRLRSAAANERLRKQREADIEFQKTQANFIINIFLCARTSKLMERLEEGRIMRKAVVFKNMSARKIQVWYKKIMERCRGVANAKLMEEFNACRVINKFFKKYVRSRRKAHTENAALLVKRFLEDQANSQSNFAKLVKRYRYKAVSVQRHWRVFMRISKHRLLLLKKMWDSKEKEVINRVYETRIKRTKILRAAQKQAIEEDLAAMKKNRSNTIPRRAAKKTPADKKEASFDSLKDEEPKTVPSTTDKPKRVKIVKAKRTKRLKIPPEEIQKLMVEALNMSSRKPGPGEIGAETRGPKSMKISKKVKEMLLKRLLRRKRVRFRNMLPELIHEERIKQTKSSKFNVEDVRVLLTEKPGKNKVDQSTKILERKIIVHSNEKKIMSAIQLFVYSTLEPDEIENLIEEGIEMMETSYERSPGVAKEKLVDELKPSLGVQGEEEPASDNTFLTTVMPRPLQEQTSESPGKEGKESGESKDGVSQLIEKATKDLKKQIGLEDEILSRAEALFSNTEKPNDDEVAVDDTRASMSETTADGDMATKDDSTFKKDTVQKKKIKPVKKLKKQKIKTDYLSGDAVFDTFMFDARFGWIRASDLKKYENGDYPVGETNTESFAEENKNQSVSEIVASRILKQACINVSQNMKTASEFCQKIIDQSFENIVMLSSTEAAERLE
jgi:hypothetical protein